MQMTSSHKTITTVVSRTANSENTVILTCFVSLSKTDTIFLNFSYRKAKHHPNSECRPWIPITLPLLWMWPRSNQPIPNRTNENDSQQKQYTKQKRRKNWKINRWLRMTISWSTLNPRGPMRVSSISAASRCVRYDIESGFWATLSPIPPLPFEQKARIAGLGIGKQKPWIASGLVRW